MKIAIVFTLVAAVHCGGPHVAAQGPDDAGTAPGPTGSSDPAPSDHWVLEAAGVGGSFQSPAPGDIWAGPYHRVNGTWIRAFRMSGDLVWVASPTEVWTVESKTSLFHVWTPSGESVTDLSKPGREFTAVGDGWIAFRDFQPYTSTCCNGSVGLALPSGGSLAEVPLPDARATVTDIYAGAALTGYGEVFSRIGSNWTASPAVSPSAGPTSMYSWGRLSGGGSGDLYATAWLYASHLDGSAWSKFEFPDRVPTWIWARPYGPRWAIGRNAIGYHVFEWDGASWQDRGPAPGNSNTGAPPIVGSDGVDVFLSNYDGIYRYVP